MAYVPVRFVDQAQLDEDVQSAIKKLSNKIVNHVAYNLGVDSTGEPALFFRVVLTDAASKENTLAETTGAIAATIFNELRPYERWGLTPYFSFRSNSEQNKLHDPEWA